MSRFRLGLTVGKFYPPHRGHKFLIDTAQARSDQVIVLVVDTPGQSIGAAKRAEWLREIHPTADVRVIPDIFRDDDSAAWAEHTKRFLGFVPDVVFTSESYGTAYARCLGCVHVPIDPARAAFPVSGTAVRADPFARWEFLEPCVRAYFVRRVCVLGAESTGTTTLAKDLAAHYRTVWVPEYGRLFAEGKYAAEPIEWRSREFVHIARQQARLEDELARSANKVLVCDTDPFATTIWHERYIGRPSPEVRQIAASRPADLYLLTGDETPFIQDGTRDGEHLRHWMHRRFEEALRESGSPFAVLRGSREDRLKEAVRLVDGIMAAPSYPKQPGRAAGKVV